MSRSNEYRVNLDQLPRYSICSLDVKRHLDMANVYGYEATKNLILDQGGVKTGPIRSAKKRTHMCLFEIPRFAHMSAKAQPEPQMIIHNCTKLGRLGARKVEVDGGGPPESVPVRSAQGFL